MGIGILKQSVLIAITLLTVMIFWLFFKYDSTIDEATKRSRDIVLSHVKKFSQNIEAEVRKILKEGVGKPLESTSLQREEIENKLSLFVGEQYPYVFIVTKDKDGKYRYVVDGSMLENEKGEFKQKFDPASDVWNKAYNNKKPEWQMQDTITGLWMTYIHPVVVDNEVSMMVAFDFSTKEFELVDNMFSPIRNSLMLISLLLGIFLLAGYVFVYLFYRQRKKISIDPLTNLFNRYFLNEIQDKIVLEHIAVAVIDLDYFKKINDSYGHLVGDAVLKEFATRLRKSIRSHDFLIRYGGEEFLLFLNVQKNEGNPVDVMKRIQYEVCKDAIEVDEFSINLTFSVGLNSKPTLNRSLKDAIDSADKMLYLAKTNGRNRLEVYEDRLANNSQSHVDLVLEAIRDERLKTYFQPIVSAKNLKLHSYEALVRVEKKDGSVLPPFEFLPHIKETRAYREMSKAMLNNAFEMIKKYKLCVHVNFDTGDFFDDTLNDIINDSIKENKDLASKLTIELLEDREIKDFREISTRIDSLKKVGVQIAVDDFGSGYSTFSYILEIKPHSLKIDGSLIKQITKDGHAKEIISSIINVCKALNIKTVAEFVENEEIIKELRALRVDYLQGYAIGKPSPTIDAPIIK